MENISGDMSIHFGVITVSDRSFKGERDDTSGPALINEIQKAGWQVMRQSIIPDDILSIRDELMDYTSQGDLDIILTTGGTGFSPRDVTPEATLAVIDRPAPGLAEAMRVESLKITPHAMLSRAVAGIRKNSLIINLPGSPKGAVENFKVIQAVLPHAVQLLRQDPGSETGHVLTGLDK